MWYHCSVYQAPFTSLAPFLTKLAYLTMLFILEMDCTASSADHVKNKKHVQISKVWQKPSKQCEIRLRDKMVPGIMYTTVPHL